MFRRPLKIVPALLLLATLGACGTADSTTEADAVVPVTVAVTSVSAPTPLVPNSSIQIDGLGFADGTLTVSLEGTFVPEGGAPLAVNLVLSHDVVSPSRLRGGLDGNAISELGSSRGSFSGRLVVTKVRDGQRASDSGSLNFQLVESLTPSLDALSPDVVFFGDELQVRGTNFLIGAEGSSVLTLAGSFTLDDGGSSVDTIGKVALLATSRTEATVLVLPDLLGVSSGRFKGTASLENLHAGNANGEKSDSVNHELTLARPTFTSLSSFSISRGRSVQFTARGLLPLLSNAGTDQLTLLRLEGQLLLDDFSVVPLQGNSALLLGFELESLTYDRATFILRYDDLGAANISGQFQGTIAPVVYYNGTEQRGDPFNCNLPGESPTFCKVEIAPQTQVIFAKFLDDFPQALERFGLRNVEALVKARILDVMRRDYGGLSIEIRDTRPTDYVEYSVVEIAGVDPNHQDLFGLDNTCSGENGSCKDTGNKRFNDVIGGKNALSGEKGFPSYGGVFVDSFFQFSKKKGNPALGTETFDEIFGCCSPELGGNTVQVGEYPGGSRDAEIAEAIRVLGNILGNTIVHEVGHSLGMTAQGGADTFHNLIDKPGAIMDNGSSRPFSERAELDGTTILFRCHNRRYLEQILPKPGAPQGDCIP
ncbi:MAG: hypothetical protein KC609_12770 [Myxococcales bacterium]|nr:hypothetical protein [Myxococcales bacterium]